MATRDDGKGKFAESQMIKGMVCKLMALPANKFSMGYFGMDRGFPFRELTNHADQWFAPKEPTAEKF